MKLLLNDIDYFAPGNKHLLAALKAFRKKESGSEEPLLFLEAVKKYKKLGSDANKKAIYDKYLKKDALYRDAIGVEGRILNILGANIRTGELTPAKFNKATNSVINGIRDNILPAFLESDEYKAAIAKQEALTPRQLEASTVVTEEATPVPEQGEVDSVDVVGPSTDLGTVKIATSEAPIVRQEEVRGPEIVTSAATIEEAIPPPSEPESPTVRQEADKIKEASIPIGIPKLEGLSNPVKAALEAARVTDLYKAAQEAKAAADLGNKTQQEAMTAQYQYNGALREFIDQERPMDQRPSKEDFKNLKEELENGKQAYLDLAEKASPKLSIEEPKPKKSWKDVFKSKKAKANEKSIEAERVAARELLNAKISARKLLEDMPEKWEKGLDKRTARELFSPLAEATGRLNAAMKSPSSTREDIEKYQESVVKARNVYIKEVHARLQHEDAMPEKRAKAEATSVKVEEAAEAARVKADQAEKESLLEYTVEAASSLRDANGDLDPSKMKANTIYLLEDGSYQALDKQGGLHEGKFNLEKENSKLRSALANGTAIPEEVAREVKSTINEQYNAREKIAEQAKAARALAEKQVSMPGGGGLMLTAFRAKMQDHHLKAAGVSGEEPKTDPDATTHNKLK